MAPTAGQEEWATGSTIRPILTRLAEFARFSHLTITLEGESGTGKSRLARWVHSASSRAHAPFVEVDTGAIDDQLAGSELFGHVAGAFTGATHARSGLLASANRGTLFLDEVGKATLHLQKRILNLLERRTARPVGGDREVTYDVRFVVATNVSLEDLTARAELLPDLLPRLSGFRVRVPPLRERRADIPLLAHAILDKHAALFGYHALPDIAPELSEALSKCDWPYNIRELDNVVQRILVAARGASTLTLEHCRDEDLLFVRQVALGSVERQVTPAIAAEAVKKSRSIAQAARDLGVARSTVQRQLRRHDHGFQSDTQEAV
ncbi:MAG: sigma-54-dependent Fis family transcriptional regulator [Gemmatimonadaceae bacterium]|nr:sigma-54-dependent Fis family transcriptional regulator [Gemmatimonadaceae bacterium]